MLPPFLATLGSGADGVLGSYVQFHPLVYMLKLYIEMGIADLIVKVVRATDSNITPSPYSHSRGGMGGTGGPGGAHGGNGGGGGNDTELRSRPNLSNMFAPGASGGGARGLLGKNASETGTETIVEAGGGGGYGLKSNQSGGGGGGGGITKMVRTTVSSRAIETKGGGSDDGDASSSSSTRGLQKHAAWDEPV